MGFPINPPRAPLVDQNGIVTPEWYRFFVNIQKLIGSSAGSPFDDTALLSVLPGHPSMGISAESFLVSAPIQPLPSADDLTPPAMAMVANDPLIPPSAPPPFEEALIPPTMPVQFEDFLIPYRLAPGA